MIPTTQPDSVPFLLVRPNAPVMKSDAVDEDADTGEIPSSRSVPPHAPPAPVSTTEHELPSVILDLCERELSEAAERQRATDVDGLLTVSETLEFPIPVDEQPVLEPHVETRPSVVAKGMVRRARARGFAIAAVAALMAAGGTFAGLRVYHVSGLSFGAAQHLVR